MTPSYLITGSSGFIGGHTCRAATHLLPAGARLYGLDCATPSQVEGYEHIRADIRSVDSLSSLPQRKMDVVIHLAARAEVITPFRELGDLSLTNVNGTANLLTELDTPTFVFASSSAVYGSSGMHPTPPTFGRVKPVGTYGATKALGELILTDWCRTEHRSSVALRFGNVVGRRCRGFIPFLVRHALKYPEGEVVALCRGGGRISRDYVPVEYIVSLLYASALRKWKPGELTPLNAGVGRPVTNGEVADVVKRVLKRRGYSLNISWEAPLEPGESKCIVLDMKRTERLLDMPVPGRDAVVAAIEEGAKSYLPESS